MADNQPQRKNMLYSNPYSNADEHQRKIEHAANRKLPIQAPREHQRTSAND